MSDTWKDWPVDGVNDYAGLASDQDRLARQVITISRNAQALMLDLLRDCAIAMAAAARDIEAGDGDLAVQNLRASVASLERIVRPLDETAH